MSEDQETTCVACAAAIPKGAQKCANCGTYQSYRRYLEISNVTIALGIAFLGLLTALPTTINSLNQTVKNIITPDHIGRVLSLREDSAVMYVKNNSDTDMLVAYLGCVVYFAKDSLRPYRGAARALLEDQAHAIPQLQYNDVINPIILAYKTEPRILASGEAEIFNFELLASMIVSPRIASTEKVDSFCGLDMNSSMLPFESATIIPLDLVAYADFGLRELIAETEILPSAQTSANEINALLSGYDGSETIDQVIEFR